MNFHKHCLFSAILDFLLLTNSISMMILLLLQEYFTLRVQESCTRSVLFGVY